MGLEFSGSQKTGGVLWVGVHVQVCCVSKGSMPVLL